MLELNSLSLFGVFFYAITAALAIGAARSAKMQGRGAKHFTNWLIIAVFFLCLMAMRGLAIEDWTEDSLRRALKTGQIYQDRREMQAALAAGLASVSLIAAAFAARAAIRKIEDRGDMILLVANAASLAMAALVGLRLLSYHTIDALLYGLRLNWVIDIGSTVAVAVCALLYLRFARRKKAPSRRESDADPIAKRVMAASRSARRPEQ